jgi:hypothetical protein
MRLVRAHRSAFREYLRDHGTNRLYKLADQLDRQHPLPDPTLVRKTKGGLFGRCKKDEFVKIVAKKWVLGSVGRKERKLVVVLSLIWDLEDGKPALDYAYDLPSEHHDESGDYPTFVSDQIIYPLTPQQAMWVGAQNLKSTNVYAVCWGTQKDVEQLQREFPFPIALPSVQV